MKGESIFMEVLYLDLLTTEDPKAKHAFLKRQKRLFWWNESKMYSEKKYFILFFNQMYTHIDDLFLVQVLSLSNWKDSWTRSIMKWSSFDL